MLKRFGIVGFGLVLATLAWAPVVAAHDTQCGGGATTGGLCLIVCDQTHRTFPGSSHKCTYTPSSYCDLIGVDDVVALDGDGGIGDVCALV